MSNVPQVPSAPGWYSLKGNADDLVYFDGRLWTWRRWRLPGGEWRQDPVLPPSPTVPKPAVPPPSAEPPSWGTPVSSLLPQPEGSQPSTTSRPTTGPRVNVPLEGQPTGSGRQDAPGGFGPGVSPGWGRGTGRSGVPPNSGGFGYQSWPAGAGGPVYPRRPGGSSFGGPPASVPSGVLDLHLPEPQRQARWTTLLRALLVIPSALVLLVLQIAVGFVSIIMWFAALITAHVPDGLWLFSKGVLQWRARTSAYAVFLTDRYPPFKRGDVPYPVSVTLGPPDRFNRLAVLFRFTLVVPANIVTTVFTSGVLVFTIAAWLVTLVLGRCPRSLHLLLSAWLRYHLRYAAFYSLLTTVYPAAALGDPRSRAGTLEAGEIVLQGTSRRLAVTAILLGIAISLYRPTSPAIALEALIRSQTSSSPSSSTVSQWNALRERTVAADSTFRHQVQQCAGTWQCVKGHLVILQHSVQTQITTLETIFPTGTAHVDAEPLVSSLDQTRSTLAEMQSTQTQQAFNSDLVLVVTLTRDLSPLVRKVSDELAVSCAC